uniref:gamma-interferon-inducible lysosomal thiol reductase-like n=1 Tax=Pristiophorus japonicus TaxID=55135 RepID=UPI00398EECB4
MHYLKNAATYLPLICCIESASAGLAGAQGCLQVHAVPVSWDTILSCANGDQGNELMHHNSQMTNELEPSHHYVPWILINGEHSEGLQHHAENDLFDLVCNIYTGSPPVLCDWRDDI